MERKGILYIPLSYNADSMKNIINIVFCNQYCSLNKLPFVDKINFLATSEFTSEIMYQGNKITGNDFCQLIRREIGDDCVEIRQRVVSSYARDIPKVIMDGVKEVGKDNIIIDLTCGKKDITGSLYMTASIGQISNMIYVEVPRVGGVFPVFNKNDYESMISKFNLTRYESLDEIEKIASLNGMDFIYYKKNIQEIRQSINSFKVESFCAQLEHVAEEYFSANEDNYRNAIRTLGLINEDVVNSVAIELYDRYESLGLKKYNPKRSINTIAELEVIYQKKETPKEVRELLDPFFSKLSTPYELFETIRIYRNRASHYLEYKYKREEVKLLIDMIMLIFNGLIESGIAKAIWADDNEE